MIVHLHDHWHIVVMISIPNDFNTHFIRVCSSLYSSWNNFCSHEIHLQFCKPVINYNLKLIVEENKQYVTTGLHYSRRIFHKKLSIAWEVTMFSRVTTTAILSVTSLDDSIWSQVSDSLLFRSTHRDCNKDLSLKDSTSRSLRKRSIFYFDQVLNLCSCFFWLKQPL